MSKYLPIKPTIKYRKNKNEMYNTVLKMEKSARSYNYRGTKTVFLISICWFTFLFSIN